MGVCKKCNGKGKVKETTTLTCPACQGRGSSGGMPCGGCGGTGREERSTMQHCTPCNGSGKVGSGEESGGSNNGGCLAVLLFIIFAGTLIWYIF